MKLFTIKNGAVYHCRHHNMFTVYYSCVSLNFYLKGLKKMLSELKKVEPKLTVNQRLPMNISNKGVFLNLSKQDVKDMIYLIEGTLCAYYALDLIAS